MAKATFNLKGAKDKSFSVLPEDKYVCYLFNVEHKSASSGNPMLVLTLKIADGDFKGRQLWSNIVLIESCAWKQAEALEAFGVSLPEDEEELANFQVDFDELLGSKCIAVVEHQTYKGEPRAQVTRLESCEGGNANVADGGNDVDLDDAPF